MFHSTSLRGQNILTRLISLIKYFRSISQWSLTNTSFCLSCISHKNVADYNQQTENQCLEGKPEHQRTRLPGFKGTRGVFWEKKKGFWKKENERWLLLLAFAEKCHKVFKKWKWIVKVKDFWGFKLVRGEKVKSIKPSDELKLCQVRTN